MVMGKVSKAIAASFLCLLFNAGGNVANASKIPSASPSISTSKEEKKDEKKDDKKDEKTEKKDDKKDEGDKTPDGEKSIWRWLLPILTGVGGGALGVVVGKFVL